MGRWRSASGPRRLAWAVCGELTSDVYGRRRYARLVRWRCSWRIGARWPSTTNTTAAKVSDLSRREVRRIPLPRSSVNELLDDVPTSLSDYHHRAWCVPDHRVRDASHQSPPYPPVPPAAHHDQTDP